MCVCVVTLFQGVEQGSLGGGAGEAGLGKWGWGIAAGEVGLGKRGWGSGARAGPLAGLLQKRPFCNCCDCFLRM